MTGPFHEGELALQARAAVRDGARRLGRTLREEVSPEAQEFVRRQPIVIATTVDGAGRPWVSLLAGAPGFVEPLGARIVQITPERAAADPLWNNVTEQSAIGLLAIEFATRSRLRLNGRATLRSGTIEVRVEQVYGNCPNYVHARARVSGPVAEPPAGEPLRAARLTDVQRAWIAQADTFFIGSLHPEAGADASHRGGPPGFIRVVDDRTLLWPDFPGNRMFQTLGNLAVDPRAGLLFLNFDEGHVLQLTGEATVQWVEAGSSGGAGIERIIKFRLDEAVARPRSCSWRWHNLDPRFRGETSPSRL